MEAARFWSPMHALGFIVIAAVAAVVVGTANSIVGLVRELFVVGEDDSEV
jgi:hypothetical protein